MSTQLREKWLSLGKQRPVGWKERFDGRAMVRSARNRANKAGIPYDLTVADGPLLLEAAGATCPICDGPFDRHVHMRRPSLDRLEPNLGYVHGNVLVICCRCNLIKHNTPLSVLPEELERLAAKWRAIRGE